MKTAKELRTEIFTLHTGTRPKAKDVMAKVDEYLEQALKEQREIMKQNINLPIVQRKTLHERIDSCSKPKLK